MLFITIFSPKFHKKQTEIRTNRRKISFRCLLESDRRLIQNSVVFQSIVKCNKEVSA